MSQKFKKIKEKNIKITDKTSGLNKKMILKTFELPNGLVENFYVNNEKDSVQIIALTKNKELVLVEQYRPAVEEITIELPGGGIDSVSDDSRKETALRELSEETGFSAKNIEFLHSQNYTLYSTGKRYTFIAFDCEKENEQDLDPTEFIKIKLVPLDEIKKDLHKGTIRGWETIYMMLDKYNML
jgi:ADP-ribose pyrophosphatase